MHNGIFQRTCPNLQKLFTLCEYIRVQNFSHRIILHRSWNVVWPFWSNAMWKCILISVCGFQLEKLLAINFKSQNTNKFWVRLHRMANTMPQNALREFAFVSGKMCIDLISRSSHCIWLERPSEWMNEWANSLDRINWTSLTVNILFWLHWYWKYMLTCKSTASSTKRIRA